MTDKQLKQAAVVALLIWWFWPRENALANTTTAQIKTDPNFYPQADWRDLIFY